jgi:cytochrome c
MAALAAALMSTTHGLAMAQDSQREPDEELKHLMQKNNCSACHYVDKRKYGPMFVEVGDRYRHANAAARQGLLDKMHRGGAGVWGEDPMPPQPQLSEGDARKILALILALPPRGK